MSSLYDKFCHLSDENLLKRVERKDSYHKETVLIAYQILTERGYQLESPYPGESYVFDSEPDASEPEIIQQLKAFKKDKVRISAYWWLLFFAIYFPLIYYSNNELSGTPAYRYIFIFSDSVINLGSTSYLLELAIFSLLFIRMRDIRQSLLKVSYKQLYPTVKIFLVSLISITFLELTSTPDITVYHVFADNSYRSFLGNSIYIFLISLGEELIFKWLLLTQLLLRVGNSKNALTGVFVLVALIFAAAHIPKQLKDYGELQYWHLFMTFLFSYFTSILYVRHNNFLLVVGLHFLLDISIIYVDYGGRAYFHWGLVVVALLCLKPVSNSWLFSSPKKQLSLDKRLVFFLVAVPFAGLFFIPKSSLDLHAIAMQYYYLGDKESAGHYVDQALMKDREHLASLTLKGNLLYDSSRYDEAWHHYNDAIRYDSSVNKSKAYIQRIRNRGFANLELRKYQECVDDLNTTLQYGMKSARIFYSRGRCLKDLERLHDAKADFHRSIDFFSDDPKAYYHLGWACFKLEEFDSTIHYAHKAVSIDPNFTAGYEVLAMAHFRLEQFDSAHFFVDQAALRGSTNTTRFFIKGMTYYLQEDYYRSSLEFQKGLEILPDEPGLLFYLGYCYLFMENYELGCQYLSKSASFGYEEAINGLKEYCE